jgi:hypothetical protein
MASLLKALSLVDIINNRPRKSHRFLITIQVFTRIKERKFPKNKTNILVKESRLLPNWRNRAELEYFRRITEMETLHATFLPYIKI